MFNKLSFQMRLFIVFSIIITFLLAASGTVFLRYHAYSLRKNIEATSVDALLAVQSRMDNRYSRMADTLKSLHASKDFNSLIRDIEEEEGGQNYFVTHPLQSNNMQVLFTSYLSVSDEATSLCYVTRYMDFYRSKGTSKRGVSPSKEILRHNPRISEGMKAEEYQLIYPPHVNDYDAQGGVVYSVVRPIRSPYETYGVLELQSDVDGLTEIIEKSSLTDLIDFSLYDEDHSLLYSFFENEEPLQPDEMETHMSSEDSQGFFYLDKNTLVCYTTSSLTGWQYVAVRDLSHVFREDKKFSGTIVVSYIVVLLILLFFLYVVTYSLTKPLKKLKNDLEKVGKNPGELMMIDIDSRGSSNEVAVLTAAIEQILKKIQGQNIQINQARESAVKAHLISMEAQMNPHFLYNTLSVIGAYGMESGNTVVMKMCSELSQLLRYTINYSSKNVPLARELTNIKSYLYVMKMRYESQLEYTLSVQESVKSVYVPKLILQPVVENCFRHGFKDFPHVWKVEIRGWCDSTYWHVVIRNNGNPFDDTQLRELEKNMETMRKDTQNIPFDEINGQNRGIGLKNTILRLHLFYMGHEIFKIHQEEPGWTSVEMGGPLHGENTEDHSR